MSQNRDNSSTKKFLQFVNMNGSLSFLYVNILFSNSSNYLNFIQNFIEKQ